MRTLLILSERKDAEEKFSRLVKAPEWELRFNAPSRLASELKKLSPGDFLYIEAPEANEDQKKIAKLLQKHPELAWGFWDPNGYVRDPSLSFFAGAADYLGPYIPPLSPGRFQKCLEWMGHTAPQPQGSGAQFWEEVQEDKEYEFSMLLVLISEPDTLKRKIGEARFASFLHDWKSLWDTLAQEHGGRLWMDISTAALFLFPPGKDQTGLFSFALRQLINRDLYAFENLRIDQYLDFKLSAHRGTAVYRKPGNTGTVVSDAVNSVFHLGQKFAQPNALYFTAILLEDVPKKLLEMTTSAGEYEGRQIYRLEGLSF